MIEAPPDLTGVTLLAPDEEAEDHLGSLFKALSSDYRDVAQVESEIIQTARELGATIVGDENGDPDFTSEQLAKPNTYGLRGSREGCETKLKALFDSKNGLPLVVKRPYLEWQQHGDIVPPFVLGSVLDGGEGKYLIEDLGQMDKFAALNEYYSDQPIDSLFEVSEFIKTPSDHYTSYRIVTSATGEILAAGLLYSSHTVDQRKRVAIEPRYDFGMAGSSKIAALENPATPYFINALDIRSNLQQGGRCIPLIGGENARTITSKEEDILAAHDIPTFDVEIPAVLRESVSKISQIIHKAFGLVVGIDFVQQSETGEFLLLEVNAGPGPKTFAECWLRGDPEISVADSQRALLGRGLASLAIIKQSSVAQVPKNTH